MRTITLMQYVFSIILLVIIFLVMDYFWKGDEFSWTWVCKPRNRRNYHLPFWTVIYSSAILILNRKNMIINNKLRTLFCTGALYRIHHCHLRHFVCHFLKIEFQDIHLICSCSIGGLCGLSAEVYPLEKKSKNERISKGKRMLYYFLSAPAAPSTVFPIPDAPVRGQSPLRGASRSHVPPSKGGG